ncbi:MAG: arginine--tRNA ligase [Halobacteriales archaeon]
MFLRLRAEVETALAAALSELDLPADDLGIEEPPENVDAVLASSAGFRLAEAAEAPPPETAARIAATVEADDMEYVGAVTAAGPYVNFEPTDAYYADTLTAAQEADYGQRPDRGESVVVEHTSANPTGPVHVGRARNPIIGDALVRILRLAGYDVEAHYYVNDAGRQVALFTWAYETFDESELPEPERTKGDHALVRYYRKGNAFLEEAEPDDAEAAEAEIEAIMQGLDAGDPETYDRVATVVDRVLEGMQTTLDRLPATFDEFVKETRFIRNGDTDGVVDRLKALDQAVYEEDAWQLDLSGFGLEKRFVFLRSDDTTLYTTRDIAHHEWKFEEFDRAITVIGEDHKLTFEQLDAVLVLLGHDTDRLEQLYYSWVNLPGGEGMSTRAGTGIDLDDLLDEAIERARQEVEQRLETRDRNDELTEVDIERIARQVGIGAVRYDIVAKQPTKAITFEWEEALDFESQSAPYVQYVHARCCGILEEAESRADVAIPNPDEELAAESLATPEERALLRAVARFPAVVETAASDLQPHEIATYTRELAEAFNAFYRECPVLEAEERATRSARLALTRAAKHTVANALAALGVAAPDSM